MIPVSRMLIYTKLIDKMEIKSRINLSTHVSMCTKKKKKNRHDSIHITAIPSKLYTCITLYIYRYLDLIK